MRECILPSCGRSVVFSCALLRAALFPLAHVGIITAENDMWEATGHELAASLRALGLPVGVVVTWKWTRKGHGEP